NALTKGRPFNSDGLFYHSKGCKKCLGTGYSGRIPIYEILTITPAIAEAIEHNKPASKIRELAVAEGMVELTTAGLERVAAGKTTLEEVFYKISS
ncbi:MAG: hypothetical protein KC492_34450, partial [Myxococcales bacterium]|nr:hypothetical protein [Myxococcales bacterium]